MFSPSQSPVFIDSLTNWYSIPSSTLNSNMSITGQLSTLPTPFLPYYHCVYYPISFPPTLQPFRASLSPHGLSSVIAMFLSLSKLGTECFTHCRLSVAPSSPISKLGPTWLSIILTCHLTTHGCPLYIQGFQVQLSPCSALYHFFFKSTYLRSFSHSPQRLDFYYFLVLPLPSFLSPLVIGKMKVIMWDLSETQELLFMKYLPLYYPTYLATATVEDTSLTVQSLSRCVAETAVRGV